LLAPPNANELIDESPSGPFDSADPHYGFSTVDNQFAQVFQGLVQYNGSDSNHVVPSLASSWTISSDYENYTFRMRQDTWFSNLNPINAYTAWFSFVRVNYMDAPTGVGYSNYDYLLYNNRTAGGNVVPWGLYNALMTVGVPDNEKSLTSALNQMLSNFNPLNGTQDAIMSYPHQALVVIDSATFRINLLRPYQLFLLALPPQWGAIVDPSYIDANGGVTNNTVVTRFNTGGMPGSGPYEYQKITPYTEIVLRANPNYWAAGVQDLSPVLAPAKIQSVIIMYASSDSSLIGDFGSNRAQISFETTDLLNQMYASYHFSPEYSFASLLHNFGPSMCEYGTGMNGEVFPTNITDFRLALVHAVNYSDFISKLYELNGTALATLFLPPVPPGWGSLDNPGHLGLYSYNISLAEHYLNLSGYEGHFYTVTPQNTTIGDPSGTLLPAIPYYYQVPATTTELEMISIMQQGFAQIGVQYAPTATTLAPANTAAAAAPYSRFPPLYSIGWCGDWPDPIFQQFSQLADPALNPPTNGSVCIDCLPWGSGLVSASVSNSTLLNLLRTIPFETTPTQLVSDATKAWAIYTQLAGIIQNPDPDSYILAQPYVQGIVYNPFEFACFYNMMYYQTV